MVIFSSLPSDFGKRIASKVGLSVLVKNKFVIYILIEKLFFIKGKKYLGIIKNALFCFVDLSLSQISHKLDPPKNYFHKLLELFEYI